MTKIFLETSAKNNEYMFIKNIISAFCNKEEKKDYVIITTGGKDNLDSQRNQFLDHEGKEEKNAVIFDADFSLSTKDDTGGYVKRSAFLHEKIKNFGADKNTDLFLFPNNKDDGAFEDLLEKIIQPEHRCILDYFKEYENNLSSCIDVHGNCKYSTPDQKAKMYSYAAAVKIRTNSEYESFKKGDWSFLDTRYWNLRCDYLVPLKLFLQNIFGVV